jgi:VIT1/CCC1 family predicted Fe2+/Mn2+ transporter
MPHQANTDANLSRAGEKQRANGARLLLIGGILFAIGLIITLIGGDENLPAYIGVTLMTLAAPPTIAGLALFLSGVVSGRASKQKPFA